MFSALETRPAATLPAAFMLGGALALLGGTAGVALALSARAAPPAPTLRAFEVPAICVASDVVPVPAFEDARPWPRGMVLAIPPVGDAMPIVRPHVIDGQVIATPGLVDPLAGVPVWLAHLVGAITTVLVP